MEIARGTRDAAAAQEPQMKSAEGPDGEIASDSVTTAQCAKCGKDFVFDNSKRGRKPSKCADCRGTRSASVRKSEVPDLSTLPPELVEFASILPLLLASKGCERVTQIRKAGRIVSPGVSLNYSPEALRAVAVSFKKWIATLDLDLSPGWALVIAYGLAVTSAVPDAMGQMAARNEGPKLSSVPKAPANEVTNAVSSEQPASGTVPPPSPIQ